MKIACVDEKAAKNVRATFLKHGILREVATIGPKGNDAGLWIEVNLTVNLAQERTIRREIGRIIGATISDA